MLLGARAAAADGEPAADEGAEHRAGEAALVRQPGAGGWLKIPPVELILVGASSFKRANWTSRNEMAV